MFEISPVTIVPASEDGRHVGAAEGNLGKRQRLAVPVLASDLGPAPPEVGGQVFHLRQQPAAELDLLRRFGRPRDQERPRPVVGKEVAGRPVERRAAAGEFEPVEEHLVDAQRIQEEQIPQRQRLRSRPAAGSAPRPCA